MYHAIKYCTPLNNQECGGRKKFLDLFQIGTKMDMSLHVGCSAPTD